MIISAIAIILQRLTYNSNIRVANKITVYSFREWTVRVEADIENSGDLIEDIFHSIHDPNYLLEFKVQNYKSSITPFTIYKCYIRAEFILNDLFPDKILYANNLIITIRIHTSGNIEEFDSISYKKHILNLKPNTINEKIEFGIRMKVKTTFKILCRYYTRINCQFPETIDPKNRVFTHYETGITYCKNINKCDFTKECDKSLCSYHGNCYKTSNRSEYCVCYYGYSGKHCEHKNCDHSEEEYLFGTEESINLLKEKFSLKSIPSCSICPDLGPCIAYPFGNVCESVYDPNFCKNKEDCTQFCKNKI